MSAPTLFPVPATDAQRSYIRRLLLSQDVTGTKYARSLPEVEMEVLPRLTKEQASTAISELLALPIVETPAPVAREDTCPNRMGYLTAGMYESKEGIFLVQPNKTGTRMYAKKLTRISTGRVTVPGERVDFEFLYEPGACGRLLPSDKMPYERARELTIRYGRCIACGRVLRAADSVERGIGPKCRKNNGWGE